jgi:hypothetical protein
VRIFAYFGVCNGLITKRKPDLTRPVPGRKTWHSRIRGNQRKTRGNTMQEYEISFSVGARVFEIDLEDAMAKGQEIINLMTDHLALHGIEIDAIVEDNGIDTVN